MGRLMKGCNYKDGNHNVVTTTIRGMKAISSSDMKKNNVKKTYSYNNSNYSGSYNYDFMNSLKQSDVRTVIVQSDHVTSFDVDNYIANIM